MVSAPDANRQVHRKTDKCQECGAQNLIHDYGTERICGDCGLVLYDQMMDKGPEWRALIFRRKVSRSRVGVHRHIRCMIRVFLRL